MNKKKRKKLIFHGSDVALITICLRKEMKEQQTKKLLWFWNRATTAKQRDDIALKLDILYERNF